MLGPSCGKVNFTDVGAGFVLSDATWFEEEQTLFVFARAQADQGIGKESVLEVRYRTDEEIVDWTAIDDLPKVHRHVPATCGEKRLCASTSLNVPLEPREVEIRLRYHRDGDLALDAPTNLNVVGAGPDHRSRSLVVYGVFDRLNERIQWRSRHQFPTLRNEEVQDLGLRRFFEVREARYGVYSGEITDPINPYLYGAGCSERFDDAGLEVVSTDERAVFQQRVVPIDASTANVVCGTATVEDALGPYETTTVARKNPETRPAFPTLRSPVADGSPIKFFLAPCDRTIDADHEEMQRQRLQMENTPTTCTDGWESRDFARELGVAFRDAIETRRAFGEDMILVVGVHRDDAALADAVEEALERVVPDERHRSSPRVAGAYVFDSDSRGLRSPEISQSTLWCPSTLPEDDLPDASQRTCPVIPDELLGLDLGPLSVGTLPILPTRTQFLDFIDEFSKAQAGEVELLRYRVPEFSVTADHVDLGDFGVVTFLDDEWFGADRDEAFSYCEQDDAPFVAFRSPLMQEPFFQENAPYICEYSGLPPELCEAEAGLLPLEILPEWHSLFGESAYELGLFWEFPFLLKMDYRVFFAGSVGVAGFNVPFGLGSPADAFYGSEVWVEESFDLSELLTQCDRFCEHPTFDNVGIYRVQETFRANYAQRCFSPAYPEMGDGGFPVDP